MSTPTPDPVHPQVVTMQDGSEILVRVLGTKIAVDFRAESHHSWVPISLIDGCTIEEREV